MSSAGDFDPQAKPNPGRSPFRGMTFGSDGSTESARWIWSGDTLMDLDQNVALKILPQTIEGADYLFIEAGGFSPKNSGDWKSPLLVLKKQ